MVPVTAKLSRGFYEKLGDEVANELVNWFNAVDTAYRSDLRELNELNFARFDAKVGQRFAEQDANWERRFAETDAKWERRFAEQDGEWERRFARLEGYIAAVRTEMAVMRSDLLKWMFLYWAASVATTVGLVVTVLRLGD